MPGRTDHRVEVATTAGGTCWFPLIEIVGAETGPTLALTAGIHGDEYEGVVALQDLARSLDPAQLRGRVRIVPVAHVAAFAAGTRSSPVDGLNLARTFPGDPGGTLTQRLAAALMREVVSGADLLVDCHSGGVRLAFAQVAGFYDADDSVARALGFPWLWRLPPREGVLSFEAHRRGIRVAGCEAGGRGGCEPADSTLYRDAILRLMAAESMLDTTPPPAPRLQGMLDGDWQLAPVGGLIESHVAIGDTVGPGTPLATIRDVFGTTLVNLTAPFDGTIMGTRHLLSIEAGEWATCLVRKVET